MITDGNILRSRGDNWELDSVKHLLNAGFNNIGTARLWNEKRDSEGIDIVAWDEEINGRFPYNVSCKATSKLENYPAILGKLPKGEQTNVLFHRKYYQGQVVGEFAILNLNDFIQLISR